MTESMLHSFGLNVSDQYTSQVLVAFFYFRSVFFFRIRLFAFHDCVLTIFFPLHLPPTITTVARPRSPDTPC
jgi:hypothetical protein